MHASAWLRLSHPFPSVPRNADFKMFRIDLHKHRLILETTQKGEPPWTK
jgi:hypothetical protein